MANIGIDLGTTFSLVAVVLDGRPRCLLDEAGRATLPSAVRYERDGRVVTGFQALDEAPMFPGRTFTSVKRLLGRAPHEVTEDLARFRQARVESDDKVVRFRVDDRAISPVEVSADILRSLRRRAEAALLGNVGGAVITVPAYFDDAQRQATRDAARLAGLDVLRLLAEPTAAAIAHGLEKKERGRFAIYDLGGGTLDVSILDLTDGVFQVLATAGDTHLGGDDMDQALALLALEGSGISPDRLEGADLRRLKAAARQTKHALTDAEEAVFHVDLSTTTIERSIGREAFEAAIAPLVERTGEACRLALRDAAAGSLDGVVLVGGSTRIPLVRRYVEKLFGMRPFTDLDPDRVVAMGAAMQADILGGQSELADDLLLLDVLPLSLGLEVMGGVVERLIPRASTIPAQASQLFTTHVDGQTGVDMHVVQGEREMARDCRSLARFKLSGLPAMPAGVPRVQVDFLVDADGILRVTAKERHTGVEATVEVVPSHGLGDEEIETMIEDALDHAEDDVNERFLAETRVEALQVLQTVESALRSDADLLLDGEEARIVKVIAELKGVVDGADRKRIRTLSRRLDWVTAPFSQRRIERHIRDAVAGQSADLVAERLGPLE